MCICIYDRKIIYVYTLSNFACYKIQLYTCILLNHLIRWKRPVSIPPVKQKHAQLSCFVKWWDPETISKPMNHHFFGCRKMAQLHQHDTPNDTSTEDLLAICATLGSTGLFSADKPNIQYLYIAKKSIAIHSHLIGPLWLYIYIYGMYFLSYVLKFYLTQRCCCCQFFPCYLKRHAASGALPAEAEVHREVIGTKSNVLYKMVGVERTEDLRTYGFSNNRTLIINTEFLGVLTIQNGKLQNCILLLVKHNCIYQPCFALKIQEAMTSNIWVNFLVDLSSCSWGPNNKSLKSMDVHVRHIHVEHGNQP